MKQRYIPHPSGIPPVTLWPDGNIHVDGREFGPTRVGDRKVTAEENASEFIAHHYGGERVTAAFQGALDLFTIANTIKRGRR